MAGEFNPAALGEAAQNMSVDKQRLLASMSAKAAKNEKRVKPPKKNGWQEEGGVLVPRLTAMRMEGRPGHTKGPKKKIENQRDVPTGTSTVGQCSRFSNHH